MILIKFYTDEEYKRSVDGTERFAYRISMKFKMRDEKPKGPETFSWSDIFYEAYDKAQEPPFRDPESVAFLKECEITFVDGDWYSVMHKGTRMPLSGLEDYYKFVLSAIACSRKGKFLWFDSHWYGTAFEYLSNLPFDILFAVRRSYLESIDNMISMDVGCKFINFPYEDKPIEVLCRPFYGFESKGYTSVPCGAEDGYCLYQDKDGVYYCDEDVSYILRYRWWNDIDNVIRYIDSCKRNKVYLSKPSQTYSLLELGEILIGDENAIAGTWYLQRLRELKKDYDCGRITKGDYESGVRNLQDSHDMETYHYYRDKFKAICHLVSIPEEKDLEDLGILIVDKSPDGTYRLIGDKTYFKPRFCDCISSMLFRRDSYVERVGLAVAGKFDWRNISCLGSVKDIDKAIYGFRVLDDGMEIFDQYEAVQTFGAALKEAHESGTCVGYQYVGRVMER